MERLFIGHKIRKQECLDGLWDFQPLPAERPTELPEVYAERLAVPACWEMFAPFRSWRGEAAYRKDICLSEKSNLRLLFKGVSHRAAVYLDGEKLGSHYNAYTAFACCRAAVEPGRHRLELLVDNRFSETSKLHIPNDYFSYGGITRSVFLEEIADLFIERLTFTAFPAADAWEAEVCVYLSNLSSEDRQAELRLCCAGECVHLAVKLQAGCRSSAVTARLHWADIRVWEPEQPVLYFLEATLYENGAAVDDLIERVGFRTVEAADGRILLNGRPIFLKGVNRHEDHGIFGSALPLAAMDMDIKLIKDMGANAVRTCHYPNDELFLDLCDENGLLLWEESHARGLDLAQTTDPLFLEQSLEVTREMTEQHYNHPSVIIWGCLNECASHEAAAEPVYRSHLALLGRDRSRLNTYASHMGTRDLYLSAESVCSFNIYPGWYLAQTAAEICAELFRKLETSGNGHKPMIISEYGAGAIYNFHDPRRVKWSEEYQADVLRENSAYFLAEKRLAGIFVWQFCDNRVSDELPPNWPIRRPKSRNNKGVVDEFRRPKLAYGVLQELFRGTKPPR